MEIEIPYRYKTEISTYDIDKILEYLSLTGQEYNISVVSRNGRNLLIETDSKKVYVIFSRRQADARNAFLNQYVATVLNTYVADETKKSKEVCVYLLDTSRLATTNYIIDTYRMLKTLDIKMLNESELNIGEIKPYQTVSEWKSVRKERQDYNPGNNSTYVLESETSYTIYGKSFGANGKESALICCNVSKIAKKENKSVHLYQVKDNDSTQLSASDKKLLQYYGVIIERDILPKFEPRQYLKQQVTSTSRDQATFQYNLLNKYGKKKCFICENEIEESIIASHIHRITDIDKSNISWEEKCKAAVDPDNGIWLCANHDKMFEYGLIYFNDQDLETANQIKPLINSLEQNVERTVNQIKDDILKKQIGEFVRRNNDLLVLNQFKISTIYYTPAMHNYLDLHKARVNGF